MNQILIRNKQKQWGKDKVWDSDLNKAGYICSDCSGLIASLTKIVRNAQGYYDTAVEKKHRRKKSINERMGCLEKWSYRYL